MSAPPRWSALDQARLDEPLRFPPVGNFSNRDIGNLGTVIHETARELARVGTGIYILQTAREMARVGTGIYILETTREGTGVCTLETAREPAREGTAFVY